MKSGLVGVWSADARYGPGAQADEILVIKPDGTGWLEVWNFALCSVEWFEWTLTSPGWAVFVSTKRMELDRTNRFIESEEKFATDHLPYQVGEEETPSGQRMKVLRFLLTGFGADAFGLLREDAASEPEPKMRT